MAEHVTLVLGISAEFDEPSLLKHMTKASQKKPTNEYEKRVWSINGLTVKQYEKKLVVQGTLNSYTKSLLRTIGEVKGLTLDEKNAKIMAQIYPTRHNAMLCPECKDTFFSISGKMEGLDIVFHGECGHRCDLKPPMFMLTSRILPDMDMLISKSMSRLVELGYFNDFEIVVPDFILDVVDRFKGSGKKSALSIELDELRVLEKSGKIKMNSLTGFPVKVDSSTLQEEDKVILGLAHLTNSVLVTSDKVLRDRAVMQERPTVYVSPDDFGKIKMIQQVRKP
jgi:rRNA-processing protein FCF1